MVRPGQRRQRGGGAGEVVDRGDAAFVLEFVHAASPLNGGLVRTGSIASGWAMWPIGLYRLHWRTTRNSPPSPAPLSGTGTGTGTEAHRPFPFPFPSATRRTAENSPRPINPSAVPFRLYTVSTDAPTSFPGEMQRWYVFSPPP